MSKHTTYQPQLPFDEIEYGRCQCGCGQKTTIAPQSNTKQGYVKGQPRRFIIGHFRGGKPSKYATLAEQFWTHCPKGAPDECWEWTGYKNPQGYGIMNQRHKTKRAHRVSYELHHGLIPDGLHVLHRCDRPACCNPSHLFLGTDADNMTDKMTKDRHKSSPGSKNGMAKITEKDVIKIRQLSREGMQGVDIAAIYGVSKTLISRILVGKTWRHVR